MCFEIYDCPLGIYSSSKCATKSIPGRVRDFPEVGLKKCMNCGVTIHDQDLRSIVDYSTGSMHGWKNMDTKEHDVPEEDCERRLRDVTRLCESFGFKTILDFGSGKGQMLEILSKNFSVTGLEPEKLARDQCTKSGFQVYSDFPEIINSRVDFDVVVLFHVIEHLYNPKETLTDIYNLLPVGGIIIIETPNADDALLTLYKNLSFANFTYWSHHPILYTSYSLEEIVKSVGFKVIENTGVQRYSLENHLHWLAENKPGGHEILKGLFSDETKEGYNADLIRLKQNDTLFLIAQKN